MANGYGNTDNDAPLAPLANRPAASNIAGPPPSSTNSTGINNVVNTEYQGPPTSVDPLNNNNNPSTTLVLPEYYDPRLELNASHRVLEKGFGRTGDHIELHVYDLNGNLLYSEEDFKDYEFDSDSKVANSSLGDNIFKQIDLDLKKVLNERGFTSGKYKVNFNLQRKKVFSGFTKPFTIKQISSTRREVKSVVDGVANEVLERYIRDLLNEARGSLFFKDINLNFGKDRIVTTVNLRLNKRARKYELIFKLFEALPREIDTLASFRLTEDITSPISMNVDLGLPSLPEETIDLRGPNFKIDVRLNSSVPSGFKTYNDILDFSVTSSYENLLSKLENKEIPDIDYDYVRPVSTSLDDEVGVEASPLHFENFVHFGSATERLKNFEYKLKLIELYNSQITQIDDIPGETSASAIVVTNRKNINSKKENIIKDFDGYEKFLYFTSGSWATWPKYTTTKPFSLYSITSSQAIEWLGSSNSNNATYGGQLLSASIFDKYNQNNLNNLTPDFITDNPTNDQYSLFVNMMGHHFDQIWLYIKNITKQADTHHIRGISKELVYFTLKSLGVETFDQFENANLFEYILGETQTGTSFYSGSFGETTFVTSSNVGSIPKGDIAKNIWKRLYHNAPYLLKTKGTERGVKALMACYGVPSSILNIKEYGGPTKDKTTYKTFSYDKSSLALQGVTNANGYFIETKWFSDNTLQMSASAKSVTFRMKPTRLYPTAPNYHLFTLSGSRAHADPTLVLKPWSGDDIHETGDSTLYGQLDLYIDGAVTASTDKFPAYNGDFWNVFIGTVGTSASAADIEFGAYQSNFNKNISSYTSSVGISEASRSLTFGDPYYNNNNDGGATFASFGGLTPNNHAVYNELDQLYYSGSLQNIIYHFGELLSHETLKKQALGPFIYAGNSPSSSYTNVVLRLPLGSNNQKDSSSFHPKAEVEFIPHHPSSSMVSQQWAQIDETHHLPTPDTVGRSTTSEKVRIDDGVVDDDLLFINIKGETSTFDRQPPDYEDLGIFFSPTNEINEDIIYTLGSFRLDDYIGDPLPSTQTSSFYPALEEIKNIYYQKVKQKYDYFDYIKLIQQTDHTLFKLIEQFVPAKANTKTGLLIEPSYLERSKFPRNSFPNRVDGQTMTTGSHNTLYVDYGVEKSLYKVNSSSVVYGNSASGLDFSLDTTEYILKETPNLSYNAEFCQSPIIPYSSSQHKGYLPHKSSTLLGNFTKAKRSSIYYKRLSNGYETQY